MLTRRLFCGCIAAGSFAATAARAQTACEIFTPERQKSTTSEQAIALLKQGNERFTAGKSVNCDLMAQVKGTASGQSPFAAVLGCIDSRVPPELVFDQRIGDIFCARVAGNCIDTDILGSLEYATKVAGARVIVVLGHSNCGAIKSAVDGVKMGNITALLANFKPALKTLTPADGHRDSHNAPLVQKVTDANVRLTVQDLPKRSRIIANLVAAKQLVIVGAMHDVTTGKITWST
jgi:carbonic anhydrase